MLYYGVDDRRVQQDSGKYFYCFICSKISCTEVAEKTSRVTSAKEAIGSRNRVSHLVCSAFSCCEEISTRNANETDRQVE